MDTIYYLFLVQLFAGFVWFIHTARMQTPARFCHLGSRCFQSSSVVPWTRWSLPQGRLQCHLPKKRKRPQCFYTQTHKPQNYFPDNQTGLEINQLIFKLYHYFILFFLLNYHTNRNLKSFGDLHFFGITFDMLRFAFSYLFHHSLA